MVLTVDGKAEHVAHAGIKGDLFGEEHPICYYSRSNALLRSNNRDTPYLSTGLPSNIIVPCSTV